MTHLPECPRFVIPDKYADAAKKIGIHAGDCICEQLKTCESRVISMSMKLALSDRQLGYREGLSDAREALMAEIPEESDYAPWENSIAAGWLRHSIKIIGSLRGECQNRTENGTECAHEDTWFDRSLCYCEPNGTMHTICSDCGKKHLRDNQWGDCG